MHQWRMSEIELVVRTIIRALCRDEPNGGRSWSGWIRTVKHMVRDAIIEDRGTHFAIIIQKRGYPPVEATQ